MNINEIIENHGTEIVENLKIASEMLYEKVIWYVRIRGAIGLTQGVVVFFIWLLFIIYSFRWVDGENKKEPADEESVFSVKFIALMISLIVVLFSSFFVQFLVENLSMIIVPEFYIIDSIISKVK